MSCPSFNPVDGAPPSFQTHNPEDLLIPIQSKERLPSRCLSCKVTSVDKWVEDGVEITLKRKQLCPRHLTPSSAPPPNIPTPPLPTPVESSAEPADHTPDPSDPTPDPTDPAPDPTDPTPYPTPETADPTPTPASLMSLPATSSALDLLLDPSVYDGALPDDQELTDALATFDAQPSDPQSRIRKPWIKNRQATINKMEATYTKLSEICCTGVSLMEALDQIQVKRTKFYNTRYIVELSVVDRVEYEQLLAQDDTLLTLNKLCKQRLGEPQRKAKVLSLRQIGLLLG